jgi:hypothetical protein
MSGGFQKKVGINSKAAGGKQAPGLNLDPVPLLIFGIDILHMNFRALKLPAAFVTVINLHIEILGLIMRIFFSQPDAMIGGDIPG